MKGRVFLFFVIFILMGSFFAFGNTDVLSSFDIEGANFTYDIETGNIVSNGVLTLKSKDFRIEVENVIFNTTNQTLNAKGKVKIEIDNTTIEGAGVSIDFKKGIARVQGSTVLSGIEEDKKWKITGSDFIISFVFNEKEKKLNEVYTEKPGKFYYGDITGNADNMKYDPEKGVLILSKNVKIIKGKNTIIAENVILNLKTKKVITKGKVRIIVNK